MGTLSRSLFTHLIPYELDLLIQSLDCNLDIQYIDNLGGHHVFES